ncbi:MAG: hypothetical protein MRJ92_01555 [Nitrospira sp.]|nr:hypothetical protein [Nitrospira sp.]
MLGAQGRGRVRAVSPIATLHTDCTTLIVKERGPVKRVTVAVEGHEDAERIKSYCLPTV